ncbi:hypothetical protein QBC44DRAFT_355971 [Cladorrhinum sp. PSN332]|nr:hypothetical protein QBC44DRAFT_355971 [Cladorrhinum sp. PSN332]
MRVFCIMSQVPDHLFSLLPKLQVSYGYATCRQAGSPGSTEATGSRAVRLWPGPGAHGRRRIVWCWIQYLTVMGLPQISCLECDPDHPGGLSACTCGKRARLLWWDRSTISPGHGVVREGLERELAATPSTPWPGGPQESAVPRVVPRRGSWAVGRGETENSESVEKRPHPLKGGSCVLFEPFGSIFQEVLFTRTHPHNTTMPCLPGNTTPDICLIGEVGHAGILGIKPSACCRHLLSCRLNTTMHATEVRSRPAAHYWSLEYVAPKWLVRNGTLAPVQKPIHGAGIRCFSRAGEARLTNCALHDPFSGLSAQETSEQPGFPEQLKASNYAQWHLICGECRAAPAMSERESERERMKRSPHLFVELSLCKDPRTRNQKQARR